MITRDQSFEFEDVVTRLRVLGNIVQGVFDKCFSDEYCLENSTMHDWFVCNYDLVGASLWEVSKALDEQCDKLDSFVIGMRGDENGTTKKK